MQKLFFTILIIVTVLVTIRLHNQESGGATGLFANTATTETLIPDAPMPEPVENSPATDDEETDGEFREEHPEITSGDEETLIEE